LNIQTEEVTPDKNPASNILLNEVLDMKTLLIATLVMGFTSVNAASAAQEINHTDGKEKMGIVSASNAYTLDELSNTLSRKADGEGAAVQLNKRFELLLKIGNTGFKAGNNSFTGFCRGNASGSAGQKADIQPFLQGLHRVAECRLRNAQFARCFGKTSLPCHHKKDLQFVEVFFEHRRFPYGGIPFIAHS